MNASPLSPIAGPVVKDKVPDIKAAENGTASPKEKSTVYHQKVGDGKLKSISSLETQPTLNYNSNIPHTQSLDYSYDLDKIASSYNPLFNGVYSFENAEQYATTSIDSTHFEDTKALEAAEVDTKATTTSSGNVHDAKDNKRHSVLKDGVSGKKEDNVTTTVDPSVPVNNVEEFQKPIYGPDGFIPQNKVVAVDPVILVDKVERSLVVQWYENSVKREQRISYKKYGNAKAQQRAEGLISKLLAGSTFDQLYPEKGPPILTIFENVGKYMVSLTRDRTMREWRVDWVNSNGSKMCARWSCKKVGNEEARKRAEAFAYSMSQGTFNPRLLHKATGTRLSKNDMKYAAVVNGVDSTSPQSRVVNDEQSVNNVTDGNWHCLDGTSRRTTSKRRAAKDSNEGKKTSKRKSGNNLNPTATTVPTTINDSQRFIGMRNYPYMCHDGGYGNPYYPLYTEDCESSASINNPAGYCNPAMLQQNWMDWNNNVNKMANYNTDWDYCSNPIDFQYFTQSSHCGSNSVSQATMPSSNEWINPNYVYMQHDLPTSKDCNINSNTGGTGNTEDHNDARLTNHPYYGYYPNEQSYSYESISQEQMNMMNPYFDYSNALRMDLTAPVPQWSEPNSQNLDKNYKDPNLRSDNTEEGKYAEGAKEDTTTTLANYPNLLSKPLDANGNPIDSNDHNHSISTGIYSTEHYNYINAELGDVHDEQKIPIYNKDLLQIYKSDSMHFDFENNKFSDMKFYT